MTRFDAIVAMLNCMITRDVEDSGPGTTQMTIMRDLIAGGDRHGLKSASVRMGGLKFESTRPKQVPKE